MFRSQALVLYDGPAAVAERGSVCLSGIRFEQRTAAAGQLPQTKQHALSGESSQESAANSLSPERGSEVCLAGLPRDCAQSEEFAGRTGARGLQNGHI